MPRRRILIGTLAAPVVLELAPLPAHAQTGEAVTQVVALQRVKAGDAVVTAISDGFVPIDVAYLSNITPEEANEVLAARFMGPSPVVTGVNTYLVTDGDRNFLVDAGGAGFSPDMGKVLAGLDAAGVAPADIDAVLLTHLHVDHIGALVTDGRATFANADIHVHANDVAFFTSAENRAAAPPDFQSFFDRAKEVVDVHGDRVKAFTGEIEVVPGVTSRELFGHTPGHCGYVIGSGDEALFVWGDLVHIGPIQIARPDVGIAFDADRGAAIATRKRVLARVAEERTRIAGMHIAFPGIGHVTKLAEGDGYDFAPSSWDYSLN